MIGARIMRTAPPYCSSVQGGVGQVSTSAATKTAAKSSSAAMMLNMYDPTT